MSKKTVPVAVSPVARSAAASPIVSSAHLVSPQSAELSEFGFGLIVAGILGLKLAAGQASPGGLP